MTSLTIYDCINETSLEDLTAKKGVYHWAVYWKCDDIFHMKIFESPEQRLWPGLNSIYEQEPAFKDMNILATCIPDYALTDELLTRLLSPCYTAAANEHLELLPASVRNASLPSWDQFDGCATEMIRRLSGIRSGNQIMDKPYRSIEELRELVETKPEDLTAGERFYLWRESNDFDIFKQYWETYFVSAQRQYADDYGVESIL